MSTPIHVVSFGSEGPPHDEGIPFGESHMRELGLKFIAGGATTYRGYTTRSFLEENPDDLWAVKKYSDEHAMRTNFGYHKMGLGAWRAVIFNRTMKNSKDGDIVVVHCCNFINNPCMLYFASRVRDYAEAVTSFTDLYSPMHFTMGQFCASQVLDLIEDPIFRDRVMKSPMGRCRLIIARVSPRTRVFAELFEKTIKDNPSLISPLGKSGYPGSPYQHHTAEQTVFNILAYKEGFFSPESTWIIDLKDAACHLACGTDLVIDYARNRGR